MGEHANERNDKKEKILKMKENFKKLKEKYQLQNDYGDFCTNVIVDSSALTLKQNFVLFFPNRIYRSKKKI